MISLFEAVLFHEGNGSSGTTAADRGASATIMRPTAQNSFQNDVGTERRMLINETYDPIELHLNPE
jgi:hypothetical protein